MATMVKKSVIDPRMAELSSSPAGDGGTAVTGVHIVKAAEGFHDEPFTHQENSTTKDWARESSKYTSTSWEPLPVSVG